MSYVRLFAVTALLAFSAPAMAQVTPDYTFYPDGPWQSSASLENDKPCTLKVTFNNGYELVMRRTNQTTGTLAINFQQDIFTAGENYPLNVSIPGILNSQIPFKANSSRILLAGFDQIAPDFYQDLRRSATLDIGMDDQLFRFTLTGISVNDSEFRNCKPDLGEPDQVITLDSIKDELDQDTAVVTKSYEPKPDVSINSKSFGSLKEGQILPRIMDENAPSAQKFEQKAKEEETQFLKTDTVIKDDERPALAESGVDPVQLLKSDVPVQIEAVEGVEPDVQMEKKEPQAGAPITQEMTAMASVVVENEDESEPVKIAAAKIADTAPEIPAMDTAEIEKLEAMITRLKAENAKLETQLEESLTQKEDKKINISSDNWDLEKATRLYQESELQNERLGTQLNELRQECKKDVAELETMLLNPSLVGNKGTSYIAEIETELEETRKAMETQKDLYERQIEILRKRVARAEREG